MKYVARELGGVLQRAAKQFPAIVLTAPAVPARRSCCSEAELQRSPFLGAIFEGFIATELVKAQIHRGQRRELYYFRDQQGLEVDFVVPGKRHALELIEAKATHTPTPAMANSLVRLGQAVASHEPKRSVQMTVVHRAAKADTSAKSLGRGVRALAVSEWLALL